MLCVIILRRTFRNLPESRDDQHGIARAAGGLQVLDRNGLRLRVLLPPDEEVHEMRTDALVIGLANALPEGDGFAVCRLAPLGITELDARDPERRERGRELPAVPVDLAPQRDRPC